MLKKIIIIIIGLLLLLLISFAIIHEVSAAADTAPPAVKSPSLETCKVKELNDYLSLKKDSNGEVADGGGAYKDLQKAMSESDGDPNILKIRVAFEKARKEYHDTIKCVFDVATIDMLGSTADVKITKDSLPDLTQALMDLNKPDKVCPILEKGKLKAIINGNNPANLVPPLLAAYNNYSAVINYFLTTLKDQGSGSKGGTTDLNVEAAKIQPMELIMGNEVQDSIMALDSAFETLKELRISFVMHVNFECMLKNLELYRRMMANLRSIVTVMPNVIGDASMHR